jgi:hypothetical protein
MKAEVIDHLWGKGRYGNFALKKVRAQEVRAP